MKHHNECFIEEKQKRQEFEKRYNAALKESIQLWTSTKRLHNKFYFKCRYGPWEGLPYTLWTSAKQTWAKKMKNKR